MRRPFREMNPVPIGAVGLVVAAALLALSLNLDRVPAFGGTPYSAAFAEAGGLSSGDEVRIAGVKVGEVTGVDLEGTHVRVDFRVDDGVEFGTRTRAAIKIRTVLGHKYLALQPEGPGQWPSDKQIPVSQTQAPFDVTQAFEQLSTTIDEIDTEQLSEAFTTLSRTFENSPQEVRASLRGLTRLSETIASRDAQLRRLLEHADSVTGVLAERNQEFTRLLRDGDKLLREVRKRREAIHQVLVNTAELSRQLSALVKENREELEPALQRLNNVVDILVRNQRNLDRSIELMEPFVRYFTNALGDGRWFDTYVQNLVPFPSRVEVPGLTGPGGGPPGEGGPSAEGSNGGNGARDGADGGSGPSRSPSPSDTATPSQSPDDGGGVLSELLGGD